MTIPLDLKIIAIEQDKNGKLAVHLDITSSNTISGGTLSVQLANINWASQVSVGQEYSASLTVKP